MTISIARRLAVAAFLVVVGVTLLPSAAFAGTCFCSIEDVGSSPVTATDGSSCETACAANKKSVGYMWARDPSEGPSSILQCWSKKELCEQDLNGDGVEDGKYDATYQPPECLPGWHYCYPNESVKYNLQVSIPNPDGGETTSVYDYGQYVGVVYDYLVGVGVVIAIVFVMIGGVRYVIGATSGEIGKAKEMIVKALSGLVLLLFAYVILFTVNPQLVKLEVPKLPMIRRVMLLTGGEDCTSLAKKEYDIDFDSAKKGHYDKGQCGTIANVLRDDAGADVAEGTTCAYIECGNTPDKTCGDYPAAVPICVQNGNDYRCVQCGQITPGNGCNIVPDGGLCAMLDPADTYVNLGEGDKAYDVYNVCGYTHEPSMVISGGRTAAAITGTIAAGLLTGGLGAGAAGGWITSAVVGDAYTGSCVDMTIMCQQVKTCSDYNSAYWLVRNSITNNELYDLDWNSLGDPNIVNVCNNDPCGVATVDGKSGETCAYDESMGDCRSNTYEFTEPDDYPVPGP